MIRTYTTENGQKPTEEQLMEVQEANNEIWKEITGEEVQYVRPPRSFCDKSFEKELNMFPVLWNVEPLDWSSRDVSRIVQKIIRKPKGLRNGR